MIDKSRKPKKAHLPTKICATCGRPFTWRKKWEAVWDEVRYCSERCRRSKAKQGGQADVVGEEGLEPSKA